MVYIAAHEACELVVVCGVQQHHDKGTGVLTVLPYRKRTRTSGSVAGVLQPSLMAEVSSYFGFLIGEAFRRIGVLKDVEFGDVTTENLLDIFRLLNYKELSRVAPTNKLFATLSQAVLKERRTQNLQQIRDATNIDFFKNFTETEPVSQTLYDKEYFTDEDLVRIAQVLTAAPDQVWYNYSTPGTREPPVFANLRYGPQYGRPQMGVFLKPLDHVDMTTEMSASEWLQDVVGLEGAALVQAVNVCERRKYHTLGDLKWNRHFLGPSGTDSEFDSDDGGGTGLQPAGGGAARARSRRAASDSEYDSDDDSESDSDWDSGQYFWPGTLAAIRKELTPQSYSLTVFYTFPPEEGFPTHLESVAKTWYIRQQRDQTGKLIARHTTSSEVHTADSVRQYTSEGPTNVYTGTLQVEFGLQHGLFRLKKVSQRGSTTDPAVGSHIRSSFGLRYLRKSGTLWELFYNTRQLLDNTLYASVVHHSYAETIFTDEGMLDDFWPYNSVYRTLQPITQHVEGANTDIIHRAFGRTGSIFTGL